MNDENKEIIVNKLDSLIINHSKNVLELGDINRKKSII